MQSRASAVGQEVCDGPARTTVPGSRSVSARPPGMYRPGDCHWLHSAPVGRCHLRARISARSRGVSKGPRSKNHRRPRVVRWFHAVSKGVSMCPIRGWTRRGRARGYVLPEIEVRKTSAPADRRQYKCIPPHRAALPFVQQSRYWMGLSALTMQSLHAPMSARIAGIDRIFPPLVGPLPIAAQCEIRAWQAPEK